MITLTFNITLKSNYHVGAGYGRGFDLDSVLLREADNRVVIRGTTLSGLLRDGARRLLELPASSKYGNGTVRILGRLFGEPARIKRWRFGSAHLVEERCDDSQAVQRVRIDPCMRRAEPRKLFSQEEGLAGQVFRFTLVCSNSDPSSLDEAALLVAAARNVRQLGRSRRRGLGECAIHLTGVEGMEENGKRADKSWEEWFLERFDQVWLRGTPASIAERPTKFDISTVDIHIGDQVRVRVIARLDEPLLAAQRSPAGNQFDTQQFIPGSVLLGALAGKAAEGNDLSQPGAYQNFVSLFLRGGVNFPMLYPAYHYQDYLYPCIPAPLGLLTCNVNSFNNDTEGHGAFPARLNSDQNKVASYEKCPFCNNKLEPVSGFLILKQGETTYQPKRLTEMHIRINDETQRVNKGDLFGYTVLAAGQYFAGDLVCANEGIWQKLQKMSGAVKRAPVTLYLGKGRQRGYGRVTVWLERYQGGPLTWIQKPFAQRVTDKAKEFSLTLLTDTIISDPWGRQPNGFSLEWLEPTLGLGKLEIREAYARTRIIDSFNGTLGLPRWRDLALTGGSVAWLRLVNDPPHDLVVRMQRLEVEGIGLRRNQGFGQIAFNHPVYEHRQDLKESAIALDQQMRLRIQSNPDIFLELWEEQLDRALSQQPSLDPRFESVARWLHSNSQIPPSELIKVLGDFGEPTAELIVAIGGQEEYGQRNKVSWLSEWIGAFKVIVGLLKDLQDKDPGYWRVGIDCLAESMVVIARKKGGKS